MNTKQVEELTGITRQNIRYYERQGFLEPARDNENAYRDYSEEDVRRLKMIKMLRMLDMSLKEIESVLAEETSLKEAVVRQQETLQKQQKQLQAAIEVCNSIQKEKEDTVDVDGYLEKMENMSFSGGLFAKIVDDYKQVALEEQQRQFSFYAAGDVNTAGVFESVLRNYASEHDMKFKLIKGGMYPVFTLNQITYTAARVLEENQETHQAVTRIVCKREESVKKELSENRRRMFQGIHTIMANIRRHRWKSLLNQAISLLIVVVMAFYLGNLNSTRRQLEEIPEKIPITAKVWNVEGELTSGLFISGQMLDAVYQSAYTMQIKERTELIGQLKAEPEGKEEYGILGMNRPDCVEGFGAGDIAWAKGWDWKTFQANKNVCIASEAFLENKEKALLDSISFSLERYKQDLAGISLTREVLQDIQMEIVGIADFSELGTEVEVPDVIFPIETVKNIFEENKKVYYASSLSFTVKNPMKLNQLKKELKSAGFQSVVPGSAPSYAGAALRMDDSIFIQTVTSLEKSLSLLEGFLPFVILVVIMMGYIVPHLLLQGRREEYAIMRALGTSRRRCSVLFFIEHFLTAVSGGTAGAVLGGIFGAVDITGAALVWVLFLICYTFGVTAAMWMFGRFSVAAVLSHRD